MRLGIVSDTHGHVANTQSAVRMFESLKVDAVLHCGDIGALAVVELFAEWPTHFVFGNCDTDLDQFAAGIQRTGQHCHGLFGDLEFDGMRVALLHSHDGRRFRQTMSAVLGASSLSQASTLSSSLAMPRGQTRSTSTRRPSSRPAPS